MTLGQRPQYREIPLALIDAPALPSRSKMDEDKLEELTVSMRTVGFLGTIGVVARADRFEVVYGHRRTLAAARAGIAALPCMVYGSKADALEALQHAENRHREELSPADEAIWFAELYEQHRDEGTDGLAARVGEKRAYVEGRLALLMGDDHVFEALQAERINVGVAQQLNRCTEQLHRRMLLDLAVRHGATVATASGWIDQWKRVHEPATRGSADVAASASVPFKPLDSPFACALCGEVTDGRQMRPIQVHDYCEAALLKPALAFFKRRDDYVLKPRTVDEATDLISELLDRFPMIGQTDPAQP